MELLAPAGNIENFYAALEAGADAVYVGAPGCNARNLARDLRLEDIGGMIRYCREHGKKFYLAANSLILEKELPQVLETLALIETLQPDALIVQDLGIIQLVHNYFPKLSLHASTLMLAHNKECVEMFANLGCERVVLARELTMSEIREISSTTDMELEVFVHGAMCFAYSGLCLFSSYLGGKSGLRGRCVQPCRRRYVWQGKKKTSPGKTGRGGNYLFSMNDLSGLHAIPALKEAGVVSLKIEGRLRSAHYVFNVVRAYRTILDSEDNNMEAALAEAQLLVENAMSRKLSSGYFEHPQPKDAITPFHSGNIGNHLGRLEAIEVRDKRVYGEVTSKEDICVQDRLRLHFEATGERVAFTVKELFLDGRAVDMAKKGEKIVLLLPPEVKNQKKGILELYQVDTSKRVRARKRLHLETKGVRRNLQENRKRLARRLQSLQKSVGCMPMDRPEKKPQIGRTRKNKRGRRETTLKKLPLEFWLKTDNIKNIQFRMPFAPDHFLLVMDKKMVGQAGQIKRMLGKGSRKVIWALPSVVFDHDLYNTRKQIRTLLRIGFKSFQIAHISQIDLFGNERVHFYGDYTLNLVNSQAVQLASTLGMHGVQLAIESDREGLRSLVDGYKRVLSERRFDKKKEKRFIPNVRFGLTVYGSPPLFTTRLKDNHFNYDRTLVSPKGETFTISKKAGGSQIHSTRPFSLLPYLHELKSLGIDYMVVDLSGLDAGKRQLQEISERLIGKGRFSKLSTFNYLGRLE